MTYESLHTIQTGIHTKRNVIQTTRIDIHTTRTIRTIRGSADRRVCIRGSKTHDSLYHSVHHHQEHPVSPAKICQKKRCIKRKERNTQKRTPSPPDMILKGVILRLASQIQPKKVAIV